jgi:hypothetical protein
MTEASLIVTLYEQEIQKSDLLNSVKEKLLNLVDHHDAFPPKTRCEQQPHLILDNETLYCQSQAWLQYFQNKDPLLQSLVIVILLLRFFIPHKKNSKGVANLSEKVEAFISELEMPAVPSVKCQYFFGLLKIKENTSSKCCVL